MQIDEVFQIRELALRYAQAVDRCDFAALEALWCEDGEQLIPFLGLHYRDRREVIAGCSQIADMFDSTYHAVHNHLVSMPPEGAPATEASGEVYCVAMHLATQDGQRSKLDMGLRYLDRYRRDERGRWLFSRRELLQDWQQRQLLDSGD